MNPEPVLRHGVWVAICDGAKAMVLENLGHAGSPSLKNHLVLSQDNPPTHLQGTSPPGRVFTADGRRAATGQTDFHRQTEEAFLAGFALALERCLERGAPRGLLLVAPPQALGHLRACLGEKARELLCGALARDYTGMPVKEIERQLARPYEQAS